MAWLHERATVYGMVRIALAQSIIRLIRFFYSFTFISLSSFLHATMKCTRREQLKKQEEMVARQEEMRRKTAEHEAELRTRTELAKAKAEAEGRIAQERANHDLILEKVKLEAAERRDTVLKAIADGGKLIGEGLASYIDDTEKLRNTALAVTGIAAGVYAAKTGIGIGGRFVEVRGQGIKGWRARPFAV